MSSFSTRDAANNYHKKARLGKARLNALHDYRESDRRTMPDNAAIFPSSLPPVCPRVYQPAASLPCRPLGVEPRGQSGRAAGGKSGGLAATGFGDDRRSPWTLVAPRRVDGQ